MSLLRRRSFGLLALVVACTVVSAVLIYGLKQTGAYAAVSPGSLSEASLVNHSEEGGACYLVTEDQVEATPLACANTACNSWCWEDGTHPNQGTYAKYKIPTPVGCTPYSGGCITLSCN